MMTSSINLNININNSFAPIMNALLIYYIGIGVSQVILSIIESSNRDIYNIELFIYQENVATFDIYKLTDKKSVPLYINTIKSKSVKQNESNAVLYGSIKKCDTDYFSRYITVIFFNDGTFCVTPSFNLYYVINHQKAFNLYYKRHYTNPMELILSEIN
jgi:hypothetical protein